MSCRTLLIGSILTAVLLGGAPGRADWPTPRHDTRRTGASSQGSDIKKPAKYWRSRLGGAPTGTQVYVGDVNHDASEDVLYITGGELFLTRPDGTTLWRTGAREYNQIVYVGDLDGNGVVDVVVTSAIPSRVSIVNGSTGAVEWTEPPSELGSAGAFRVGDVDGDGLPELWLDTCGCCAIESGTPGIIYSFAKGVSSPTTLGPPPLRGHCGATSDTMADVDGDGRLEMIQMADTSATVFRADGSIMATSGPLPARAFAAQCEAVDLDGKPGQELVCSTNTFYNGAGQRGLFALAYRPAESPALKLLWSMVASAADGGDVQVSTTLTADLDGDGRLEAVVSGRANGAYTTFILDAATGAQLATGEGSAAGDIPGSAPGQRLLLLDAGGVVTAHSFVANPPSLNPLWHLSDKRGPRQIDWARLVRQGIATSLLTPDLNGDGRPDLLLSSVTEPAVLTAHDVSQTPPSLLAQYALDPGVSATAMGTPIGLVGATSMFVGRNDGYVALLDHQLTSQNESKEGVLTLPGLYVGGYYTGPGWYYGYGRTAIAGKLMPSDGADALLVVDSRGDLVRIDPAGASNVAPASPSWRLPDSFGAAMRSAGSGPAGLGVYRRRHPLATPPVWVMATVSPDGQELSSLTMPRIPAFDVLPGNFTGDGTTSFIGLDADASLQVGMTAMSASGKQLWQHTAPASVPLAAADWDGDGIDDIAAVMLATRVFSGKTGAEIATGTDAINFALPILAPLGGGSQLDVIVQGCTAPVRALGHDLATQWTASGPAQPYPYGALAPCPSGPVLVEGSYVVNAQLTLTIAGGAQAGSTTSTVLASGASYPDAAAATGAGATMGQLTDVAVSTNLDGTGSSPTALVGSTDGYLYALDACTGALRWSMSFGPPVGSPILADTDGDGKDEILVSVSDGYLYALKQEILPAPAFVWDTDPPHGLPDKDVDTIETMNTLYALWAPVAGAATYEIAVVPAGGSYLTSPAWHDVGDVTSAAIPGLPLVDRAKYFVGVRAVSPAGRSPDTPSNGVVVHFPVDGGAGGAGGGAPGNFPLTGRACTCTAPGGSGGAGMGSAVLLAASAGGLLRRRRGRRAGS